MFLYTYDKINNEKLQKDDLKTILPFSKGCIRESERTMCGLV